MLSSLPAATLSRRDRLLISTCIVLITALSWAYLVRLARQMSSGMENDKMMAAMGMPVHTPWSAADVFFTFAMWAVMMVGMMAPTAAPVFLLFAAVWSGRGGRSALLAALTFVLGYIAVWVGFSAGVAVAQRALHQAALLSGAMTASSRHVAGAILIAAGAYQLTPWKGKCLTHCRSPLGFFMTNWREGKVGAFWMGIRHGMFCLGCCWALMCVLFVVGVMNLLWVSALTVFVLIEKIGPAGAVIARMAGATMIVLGIIAIT